MFKSEKGTFLFSVFLQNCFLFFCIPVFHFLALSISAYMRQAEHNAIQQLVKICQDELVKKDRTIHGFNFGVNSGSSAGQTIMHVHLHLIPRRKGDVENPIGGIRNVIPGKGDYQSV